MGSHIGFPSVYSITSVSFLKDKKKKRSVGFLASNSIFIEITRDTTSSVVNVSIKRETVQAERERKGKIKKRCI